jgi:hypothetical protein
MPPVPYPPETERPPPPAAHSAPSPEGEVTQSGDSATAQKLLEALLAMLNKSG